MIQGQHICITGGAGFIGSRLAGRLLEHNTVTVFDNLSRNSLKSCSFASHPNLRIVQGDILDVKKLTEAIRPADYVIHCAGIAGIFTVVRNTVKTLEVNMVGSLNALRAAAEGGRCKRIVCFSTSEVMGSLAFVSRETDRTVIGAAGQARWTYAVSKLAEEHLASAFHREQGLPATVVRPFNIYGPGQVGEGAMKIFINQALKNEPITIFGDGTQIRAWCYVDDMMEGTLMCLENEAAVGEAFNIGNIRSVQTIYGLANTITRVLGSKSEVIYGEAKGPDIELRIPCVDKAKELLGFEAKVDLEEGIRKTAEYYLANPGC
ncbi:MULTISPECIES: NAD-dependent epimerase/dehydratase family protein [unclassified Pseudodesulfovibrio]|uniref:NAD-dependent epimerase/dehydratase family protein n=1 Tax=unclassified Pseudodesulfovibrio TaxID=2661612 RepID=UPI000FEB6C0F|nr:MULTISPECIES: NAD-dependent epimerase/dehydratase family protein [unclassified Pseudodesulfovibrio]MCJ2165646.1 NAD-dependent epimerase/dehydratase family protein [Pseudodesulfovibrio sp. S3-i]RWU03053.1 NAD-dependent epimerase/dehydratase family protein [Pseudodesulfovibrio sp. S3]